MLMNYKTVSGRTLTSVATGGEVRLVEVPDEKNLIQIVGSLDNYRIIGKGSNVIISDSGFLEPVLQLGKGFRYLNNLGNNLFEVGGSYSVMTLARELSNLGYTGLEFAGGIPASIGGAIKMNAGAHHGEFSNIVEEVRVFRDGKIIVLPKQQLVFSYRTSNFEQKDIISSVVIKLQLGESENIRSSFKKNLDYRKTTQPLTIPSFGSVFKNPEQNAAGYFIESAGLKGYQIGNAEISSMHANWIVNPKKKALSDDLLRLIEHCQKTVLDRFQVELIPEVQIWN